MAQARFRRRRVRSAVGAVGVLTTAVVAMFASVAPAQAAPKPRPNGPAYVVAFGDSYTANSPDIINPQAGCGVSPASWPAQLQRRTGRPVMNVACSGSSLTGGRYNVYDQARKAVQRGGLNRNTSAVLVQLGFNDFGGGSTLFSRCLTVGCPGSGNFPGLNAVNYASKLRPLVDYVRHYAPRASISIVGYPTVFGRHDHNICGKVVGAPVVVPNTTAAPVFLKRLQATQKGAASRLGVGFIDLATPTKDHGICSPQPWVNGIFSPNPGIPDTVMLGHPTPVGDAAAARIVARAL